MEPGFFHVGPRELASVLLAVVIVIDWAAQRYVPARRAASAATPRVPEGDPPPIRGRAPPSGGA